MSLLWMPYMSDTKDGETVVQEHLSPDTFPVYTGNQSTSQIGGLQEDWEIYTWCWAHAAGAFLSIFSFSMHLY